MIKSSIVICFIVAVFFLLSLFLCKTKLPGHTLSIGPKNSIYYEFLAFNSSPDAPIFVLSHGLAGNMYDLKALAEELNQVGSVLYWDRLSYGYSSLSLPQSLTAEFTYQRTLELFAALDLKQPIIFVGYSLGTIHGVHFQRRNPSMVKALILIDPPLPAEKLREPNFFTKHLPQFIETLESNVLFARLGWPQLKARLRGVLGWESELKEPIYGLNHQKASLAEAKAFSAFLDQVDYKSDFGDLPLLVFSRDYGIDHQLVDQLVERSRYGRHLIYTGFKHSDFISESAAAKVGDDIKSFLNLDD